MLKTCINILRNRRTVQLGLIVLAACLASEVRAAEKTNAAGAALEREFQETIRPFVQTFCVSCHGGEKPKGDLDLSAFTSMDLVSADPRRWKLISERLREEEMPPEKADRRQRHSRGQVIGWIEAMTKYEATRTAGDPGIVPARRLSNAEFDYTIRDLTGIDIRPAREFPVDPANEAGFDNSAESLTMSPSLLKKYMEAARHVSEFLVLNLDGIEFAPHPVVTDTDRDKFCVNLIIRFYQKQRTDYADYFLAAWQFRNRTALGRGNATLLEIAGDAGISPRYLATIWATLEGMPHEVGPIAALQAMWRELPAADAKDAQTSARAGCERMRDFAKVLREKLVPTVKNLTAPQIERGSQPLVLWKNRHMAANRMKYSGGALKVKSDLPEGSAAAKAMAIPSDPAAAKQYEATFNRFCEVFPDAFLVSERARVFLDPAGEKDLTGRLLNAGFHMQTGFFRDDDPLYELLLSEGKRNELDRLWDELEYVASAPIRQYKSFVWFDRTDSAFMREPQFNFARAEDLDCISQAKVSLLEERYTAKARKVGASDEVLEAIGRYFKDMNATFRRLDRLRESAEAAQLRGIMDLAERAYRRPLSRAERDDLAAFYKSLREKDGMSHEDAIRDLLTSILMSPYFSYRLDAVKQGTEAIRPLDDYGLASRLSYFLWSSMPDKTLLDLAAAGELQNPQVLAAQAKRMLKDGRVRALASEFAGNWLDFRRFEEHNSVDRTRYPNFNDDLRLAMFEEPIRFFTYIAQNDRPVLDFLYADYTFVNPILARHYGMKVEGNEWVRVDDAQRYGRGGLLPMAVFLTKNSPGLRTSPVKRGNWVVRRVLGEYIPPPPPTVPQLPADEANLGELTLRETLVRHRADPSCAKCHARFDSFGLVFEGFGVVGERRVKDFAGRAVETNAAFPGGGEGTGLEGLRTYIIDHRQNDFLDHLCRELVAYGLGRTLQLSDEELIASMKEKLATNEYRFDNLIEAIVTSPQFRYKRSARQNVSAEKEPGK